MNLSLRVRRRQIACFRFPHRRGARVMNIDLAFRISRWDSSPAPCVCFDTSGEIFSPEWVIAGENRARRQLGDDLWNSTLLFHLDAVQKLDRDALLADLFSFFSMQHPWARAHSRRTIYPSTPSCQTHLQFANNCWNYHPKRWINPLLVLSRCVVFSSGAASSSQGAIAKIGNCFNYPCAIRPNWISQSRRQSEWNNAGLALGRGKN